MPKHVSYRVALFEAVPTKLQVERQLWNVVSDCSSRDILLIHLLHPAMFSKVFVPLPVRFLGVAGLP
jgi:hypothetical protein